MIAVIVGLGNPGSKYKNTPHNIGFEIINEFAKQNSFGEFKLSKKFKALISEEDGVILIKPQTYMNASGKSVATLFNFYKPKELIIIHDDIDLPLGKIRISKNRGSAGHKGVESIIKELNTKNFSRIRIGIKPEKLYHTEKYVLTKFKKQDKKIIKKLISQAVEEIKNYLK